MQKPIDPTVAVRFTKPELIALNHAAELLSDTCRDAHLDVSISGSALGIAHAKLISALERGEGVIMPLQDAAVMLAQAERNIVTLRVALRLVTSEGMAPPYLAAGSRAGRWRVERAQQAISEIRDAALAAVEGGE